MNEEITNLLNDWKNREEFHWKSKQFKVVKSPIVKDESIIHVSRKVKVNFQTASREISVSEKMHTNCQSANSVSENPNADRIILSKLLSKLDEEFFELYIKTENELVQEVMPDGFF